jgi:hypothetical protein
MRAPKMSIFETATDLPATDNRLINRGYNVNLSEH